MKIADFEKAIEALGCEMVMDEVKLHGGHVREFLGHKVNVLVLWDSAGRAFTVDIPVGEGQEPDCYDHDRVFSGSYQREPLFDLKFE